MAATKRREPKLKRVAAGRSPRSRSGVSSPRTRVRRSDEDKLQIVRQVMASGNQAAEIKALGIYPNQFYDWKKRYLRDAGAMPRARSRIANGVRSKSAADEAKAYIHGKATLIERLKAQRSELDELIAQLSR